MTDASKAAEDKIENPLQTARQEIARLEKKLSDEEFQALLKARPLAEKIYRQMAQEEEGSPSPKAAPTIAPKAARGTVGSLFNGSE